MLKVSACIVCYNGGGEVIRAAQSLLRETKGCEFTLYLVDNASPDGSGKTLSEFAWPENVHVICLPQNVGFGSGHNQVLPMLNSDYHFVINPDIYVDDNVLCQLSEWLAEHSEAVMVTPRLMFPTGEEQILPKRKPTVFGLLGRQGIPGFGRFAKKYAMQDKDLDQPQQIEFCTGSFFGIRTDAFKTIGGFDEAYFMYVEDADITQKALKKGQVWYLPQSHAYHAWHRAPQKSLKPFLQQLRSMGRYFKKWGFRLW